MTENETTLMERESGGVTIRLKHLPIMGLIVVEAENAETSRACTVEPEHALDAFNHPMVYLPETHPFA